MIFDLLKEKADLFYNKMLERKLIEEQMPPGVDGLGVNSDGEDFLSQDSENYNEDYK